MDDGITMPVSKGMRVRILLLVLVAGVVYSSRLSAAQLHVTTLADSGGGSLRDAISIAAPGDSILFDVTGTITLTTGELAVTKNLTILGPGPQDLAVVGNATSRIIFVAAGTTATISGLTLRNGAHPSGGAGGGIANSGVLLLTDCVVAANSAPRAGGIYNEGTATLVDCTVSDNSSGTLDTGGIYNAGSMTISFCTISSNRGRAGGGIVNSGSMVITDTTVRNNSSFGSGGGIVNAGTMTLLRSLVFQNNASDFGGAFHNIGSGSLLLVNTTVVGNTAGSGGGVVNRTSNAQTIIINSTVAGNTSFPPIGGVLNVAGTTTLKNTILASNGVNCSGAGLLSAGYNLSSDDSCVGVLTRPGDMNSTDPQFAGGLDDNGGSTPTIALVATSPAVNAIPLSSCTDLTGSLIITDQRGVTRPQGAACDIGAFEFVAPALSIAIDIKPGEGNNTINMRSNGTVLVAILSSGSFDATTVDPASVTLAGAHVVTQGKAGTPLTNLQDVDRDGRVDLVLHFKTQDLQLAPTATEAVLLGETFSGQAIRGVDSIRLLP